MTRTEPESARLRAEREELVRRRTALSEAIEHVQQVGSSADGEQYVAAREEKSLVQTRIDEIDAELGHR
ncbi:hypothetical protein ACWEVD_26070 [Nocardia thailandica]|uniref:Transcription elongation factor GreA/GreB N-terminal domain-containing protein n=1 Tax=Nocardia thailandica TaxID=257275 RepID=A0ABW6PTI2_9NOCA|nr:hypothetical protein [Nocardia thailandica]